MWRQHPVVCQEAVELMSDYIDGTLSSKNRRRLEKHLAVCGPCQTYLAQMRLTIAASGSIGPDDIEPTALADLVDVFRHYRGDASHEE